MAKFVAIRVGGCQYAWFRDKCPGVFSRSVFVLSFFTDISSLRKSTPTQAQFQNQRHCEFSDHLGSLPLNPSATLPQLKHRFKMSDAESVPTISVVDKATTVTKPEGKPKGNKEAANGGTRWTSEQVSFPV